MSIPTFSLPQGAGRATGVPPAVIPQIGFGTYKLTGKAAERAVREAIAAGYRHIDTAELYDNEAAVGRAIAAAIAAGDVTREELFVTTKVWNDHQGEALTRTACADSLRRLGLDYVDLYLVHWPCPQRGLFAETFTTLADLQEQGATRRIGVSNFDAPLLAELAQTTGLTPAVNQVELHVGFTQSALRSYHAEHGILTQAWSPLGRGVQLANPVVTAIAAELEKTPAQVVLRFLTQLGVSVIPKSSHPERIAENIDIFDVSLSDAQIARLLELDEHPGFGRMFNDPWVFPGE